MFKQWLLDRCIEVQEEPDGVLDLWARDHYKSTIITFGKTIQDILINPEDTFGIFSHSAKIAKEFLNQIKRELEANIVLIDLFPEILYTKADKESPRWNSDAIIVKRKTNPKEATVEAHGLVEGQPIGKHFKKLIYDDTVTADSVYTAEMMNKTNHAFELSLSLGDTRDGIRRFIGTRYHFGDTYALIQKSGHCKKVRIHAATHNGAVDGNPVFLTQERWDDIRKRGSYIVACQYLLNPIEDGNNAFSKANLCFYQATLERRLEIAKEMNIYLVVDPANSKKKGTDKTVMAVIGLHRDQNYYLLDLIRDKLSLKERSDTLFDLYRLWKPLQVGYEEYGLQNDIEYIEEQQDKLNFRFIITKIDSGLNKQDKIISRLQPKFENRRFWMPVMLNKKNHEGKITNVVEDLIEEEYMRYPFVTHDDGLDCISMIDDLHYHFPLAIDEYSSQNNSNRHAEYDRDTGERLS